MENLDSIFEKLMRKTNEVNGNIMLRNDPGFIFFQNEIRKVFDTGICEICHQVTLEEELERNAGICAKCTQREIE